MMPNVNRIRMQPFTLDLFEATFFFHAFSRLHLRFFI